MPRDYKHRAQRKPPKKPLPAWLWLLTGLLLGGFIVGLVWLKGQTPDAGGEWVGARPDRPPQGNTNPERRVEVPPRPKPRFDFYDQLPRMEVVVPDEELQAPPPRKPAAVDEPQARYLIQVGAFSRAEDADRRKAQLALLGFEVKVSAARTSPQETVYRVRSGPYRGVAEVNKARKRLQDNGVEGIVIRADGH